MNNRTPKLNPVEKSIVSGINAGFWVVIIVAALIVALH